MPINKVIYAGRTLIDITADTVAPETLLVGATAHDKSGEIIEGACTFDADTSDANARPAEILDSRTGYVNGVKVTGTMPNNACHNATITAKDQEITIPLGYHDGSGIVSINQVEQDKIVPANIKKGVEILGVTGTCEPSSDVTAMSKSVTPSTTEQTVLPDAGYDYLSQVTVAAIPYVESSNSAGGTTVTIAG